MSQNFKTTVIAFVLLVGFAVSTSAQRAKTNTRVFWVDNSSQKLFWGDIVTTDKWSLKTGLVEGFPEKAELPFDRIGPLFENNGLLVAGLSHVKPESKTGRWCVVDSGVSQQPHGNHFHWNYTARPSSVRTFGDDRQGSTVHLNVCNDQFYLLGDFGYVTDRASNLRTTGASHLGQSFRFSERTINQMAVVENVVGYFASRDSEGDQADQIEVVNLTNSAKAAYSFKLASGRVAGITANSGKVFFADQNAVSWITPDLTCSLSSEQVKPKVIRKSNNQPFELADSPIEFVNERNWVIFTTGSGKSSKLCMIDAAAASPSVTVLPLKLGKGFRLSRPSTVLSLGKRYAFIFQERLEAESNAQEKLMIVELDPNRDMQFQDASLAKTISVGLADTPSSGESRGVCFDDYGRFAVFTDPGAGTLSVISLHDLMLRVNFKVGGRPTEIVAVGAPEHFH